MDDQESNPPPVLNVPSCGGRWWEDVYLYAGQPNPKSSAEETPLFVKSTLRNNTGVAAASRSAGQHASRRVSKWAESNSTAKQALRIPAIFISGWQEMHSL